MKRSCSSLTCWLVWVAIVVLLAACGSEKKTDTSAPPGSTQIVYGNILAFRNSTTLAWGYNGFGQLGIGSTTDASTPVAVAGIPGMTGLAVGGYHSLAFNNHSTLAWGYNAVGQLASDPKMVIYSKVPVPMNNFGSVISIAAGGYHSLVVKTDGTVWAWGGNVYGQLGNGTYTDSFTPLQVKGDLGIAFLQQVKVVAAGGNYSLALGDDGGMNQVFAWGDNFSGQLGDGTTSTSSFPRQVLGLPDSTFAQNRIIAIAAGGSHSMALTTAGEVWTWGANHAGQLGNGSTSNSSVPGPVVLTNAQGQPLKIVAIAAGLVHCLALADDGTLWAWGANMSGQLGVNPADTQVGSNTNLSYRTTPGQVPNLTFRADKMIDGLHPILAIGNRSYAYAANGQLRAWGDNVYGALGNGVPTTTPVFTPVTVSGY